MRGDKRGEEHKGKGGELAFIQALRQRAEAGPRIPELRLGIGDDCAILRPRVGEDIVVTTDFCLEGKHFRRDWHSPQSAGHRTLARGLSDLAAMGARPLAAFLSLAIPRGVISSETEKHWLPRYLDGLMTLAAEARVPLGGGDTAEAPGQEVLADIVLLGAVPRGRALRREGARAGDRVFCTGALGGAAAELAWLSHGKKPAPKGNPGHPQLFPAPRLATGQALLRRGLATAALDLSDGLSTDLRHLCAASGVAAEIEAGRLPLHPWTLQPGLNGLDLALHGGEDYELLFTAPAQAKVPKRLGGVRLTEIGRIVSPRSDLPTVTLSDAAGTRSELLAGGWEHLR